ncbi:hypothetical protein TREMEDRAFT_46041 [Tremella mesenterica DSM 1558]|uniref:uncharacterized protein n=1 Tax=Tremella mesenterica (strain ATCC 24925 / CBS 8224 / DSM 1558 / NBRC 9311 / NRRL Y-6157 / RJB 2259-6 / UBC 559-6) TaxID=578456 RepID=UPI00032C4521|nr:uncharacterized protein TREMEDRAFT_46041 [Tremella mesenterica DSM 1558]EIW65798.1 hypothetical protein TREMEDRAFT_46041 [Tremella mesenterica DSM 1558]
MNPLAPDPHTHPVDIFSETKRPTTSSQREYNFSSDQRPNVSSDKEAGEEDSVKDFLRSLPTQADPERQALWTQLIQLKTRSLELQIAEARKKEKEAEVELERLRQGVQTWTEGQPRQHSLPTTTVISHTSPGQPSTIPITSPQITSSLDLTNLGMPSSVTLPFSSTIQSPVVPLVPLAHSNQISHDPHGEMAFDLEAMLQSNDLGHLDSAFSWLSDFVDPFATSYTSESIFNPLSSSHVEGSLPIPFSSGLQQDYQLNNSSVVKPESPISPVKRSRSPESLSSPPAKKSKGKFEKKIVIDKHANCMRCRRPMGHVMLRAPKTQIPEPIRVNFLCTGCAHVHLPSSLPDQNMGGGGTGSGGPSIGTVDSRKRMRAAMELQDEGVDEERKRIFCDVCQRVSGAGHVLGSHKEDLGYMCEIICAACESKYQRCTDCGGGGGPRIGIGKWRMRQVFQPGRKTCSLSHSRIGDRPLEIGVHVTPTDFTPEQLKEVIARCKSLWNEKTLARLAVPEMLEIDLPPGASNPLRTYEDIENIISGNWPAREKMIRADGAEPSRFKRLLGLVWAHSKPRRNVRTVDLEEEWQKTTEGEDDNDLSTVLANVRKTNVVIPPGTELINMWGGEWDMQQGSLLISTFIPFEGADGEDSVALSVGEMITHCQDLRLEINAQLQHSAAGGGMQAESVRQVEHLWVVSGGWMPLVRERIADILVRKRSFVHVEEYLTRHPDFVESIKARPYGMHPDLQRIMSSVENGRPPPKPLILVRWLGKDFDAQRILEIKQAEFGGKGKVKRKSKSKS